MRRIMAPLILSCVFLAGFAQAQTLKTAVQEREPYAGRALKDNGFCTRIVAEAFRRAGYTADLVFPSPDQAMEGLAGPDCDASFPEPYSPERAKESIYSNIVCESRIVFFRRTSLIPAYTKLKDLAPYTIGIVRGRDTTAEFDQASNLKKVESDSDEENLRRLASGELDLIVIDRLVAAHLIATRVPEAAGRIMDMEPPLAIRPFFVTFPRKLPESPRRAREFNRALESMKGDGTVRTIMGVSGLLP
jgi:ABC-type amino acid transport substrate-binding protein